MLARPRQRCAGLLIAFVSLGLIAWNWHLALTRRVFWVKASMIFPARVLLLASALGEYAVVRGGGPAANGARAHLRR